MRLRAWSGYAVINCALVAGYYALPVVSPQLAHLSRLLLYNAVGVAAVIATVVAVGRYRPPRPLPWLLFALGLAVYSGTDIAFYVYIEILQTAAPFAGWTDALFCSSYLLLSAGMLAMIRSRTPGRDRASLVDALTLATGCASVSWVFLMSPYVRDPELTGLERLTALAYPLVGVLLLAMTARLAVGTGVRAPAFRLLLLGSLSLLVGDSFFVYKSLTSDGFTTGTPVDLCWMLFYIGFGAAALHPSMREMSEPTPLPPVAISTRRLIVLAAASLLAPAMLVVEWYRRGEVDVPVIAGTSAALFLLVIARMSGLIRVLREQAAELERMARVDALTGVPNRRAWDEALGAELARARRGGAWPYVALIDVDHFKAFNDTYGHLAGDRLLREAAAAWRIQLRYGDIIARYGGEEFAVLLTGCDATESATEILERLRQATPLGQSFSAGVARWDGQESPTELVARADEALYAAKRSGRGRTEPASDCSSGGDRDELVEHGRNGGRSRPGRHEGGDPPVPQLGR